MKLLFSLYLSIASLLALEVGNGKSILIPTTAAIGYIQEGNSTFPLLPHPLSLTQGFAIVPIDYYTHPTLDTLTWVTSDDNLSIELNIINAPYPIEVLTVDNSKVSPPTEVLQRIAEEKAEAEKIYNTITSARYWNKPFIRPLDSNTTSEYGSARTYNGTLKSYHGGVDFRARTPLPILATNAGVVVLAKDRYYAGGTVIIDHGEGLYSCYFHMSRFDVKVGDRIERAQTIGLTGATGRITGPHLHFGIMIYGVQTDPIDLLTQINKLFDPNRVF
ncbi:MAG: M23 family metallopeptidase [Sulfuricurvum sp.]|uniref:M23 family metallopeptidase n=1 Tax=Sulfuricurvum sp. TaxID=2025608 RepID=UPI0026378C7B|nr:M23 family metallopeptidase [Sulfuricurvum sp.]MDD2828710.1 M23 family metallopeptidase [Sulfuricurvum sp.]MDD4949288.1 M23 family metallopeptidase [Sulfuricurvum sp.]